MKEQSAIEYRYVSGGYGVVGYGEEVFEHNG